MAEVSVCHQAKRKRGRPRKDNNNNVCRDGGLHSPENPNLMKTQLLNKINNGCADANNVVGSVVYGVIEGSFDAGYLISVTIGNEPTPFRGVIFQPKKIIPISASNDVAPQANMYKRTSSLTDDQNHTPPERASKQPVVRPPNSPFSNMESSGKSTAIGDVCKEPSGSGRSTLRMVEEDEVMQAFEVSTSSRQGSGSNVQLPHNFMDKSMSQIQQDIRPTIELLHQAPAPAKTEEVQQPLYYTNNTNVSFQQSLFNEPKSLSETQFHPGSFVSTTQSLKLSLDKPEPQSERNYGFHQALVAGNPLLLPPDLTMEKPNSEQEPRGDDEILGRENNTTETNYCMGDMNFVLNNAAEAHHNQNEAPETTNAPHSTN